MQDVIISEDEDSSRLSDKDKIKKILTDLIGITEMTLIESIQIHQFPSLDLTKNAPGGITAFGILAESHISIHTWPESNYFSLDLFSCRNFDARKVESAVRKMFKIKKIDTKVIERGVKINFPEELAKLPRIPVLK